VEENNKFETQALSPGAGLDVVREKRKENEVGLLKFILTSGRSCTISRKSSSCFLQVLFNEMLANEKRLNSIIKLHEEMQQHQTLAAEDRRKLQQEMNRIKTNWKSLEEKMETTVKR
jgi:septal ring factor EnvC (AmiA/AmiB activator)